MSVFWLALASFALGTESFVLAGLLPLIASDLRVSVPTAGQLVTAYALSYALGAPVLAVAFHNVERKHALVLALGLFIVGNLMAAAAPSFGVLMACRIVMSMGAALNTPTALSVAIAISPPERRGRAVASVMTGLTAATVLGMPLGTLIGQYSSWRAPFVLAALLAALALAGILVRMPRGLQVGSATLAERLNVARQPDVLFALLTTTLWAAGGFTMFTYLTVPLRGNGFGALEISLLLFAYGVACAAGNLLGGRLADRLGTGTTALLGLTGMATALVGVSAVFKWAGAAYVHVLAPLPIIAWGLCAWCFSPAQVSSMARSVPQSGAVALSLNASFLNLGFALGSALGGLVLARLGSADLGWVGGCSVIVSMLMHVLRERRYPPASLPARALNGRSVNTGAGTGALGE